VSAPVGEGCTAFWSRAFAPGFRFAPSGPRSSDQMLAVCPQWARLPVDAGDRPMIPHTGGVAIPPRRARAEP
jgi:hypothetical protein